MMGSIRIDDWLGFEPEHFTAAKQALSSKNTEKIRKLINSWAPGCESREWLCSVVDYCANGHAFAPPPDEAGIDATSRLLFSHLHECLGRTLYQAGALRITGEAPSVRVMGREFDFMPAAKRWKKFHAVELVLSLLKWSTAPSKSLAVVACARNEGAYMLEWLAHYRVLGADSIFVYTNENDDGSDALMEELGRHRIVTHIINDRDPSVAPQPKAYGHALRHLPDVWDHEWVLVVDIDEFLFVDDPADGRIGDLLENIESRPNGSEIGCVAFHWRNYANPRQYYFREGLNLEVDDPCVASRYVKSLIRVKSALDMMSPHDPRLLGGMLNVDSSLKPIEATKKSVPVYGLAHIKHYGVRSFEEFVGKKLRGRGARGQGVERSLSEFFTRVDLRTGARLLRPSPGHVEEVGKDVEFLRSLGNVAVLDDAIRRSWRERLAEAARKFNANRLFTFYSSYLDAKRLGNTTLAMENLGEYLKLCPADVEAHCAMADMCYESRRHKDCVNHWAMAFQHRTAAKGFTRHDLAPIRKGARKFLDAVKILLENGEVTQATVSSAPLAPVISDMRKTLKSK